MKRTLLLLAVMPLVLLLLAGPVRAADTDADTAEMLENAKKHLPKAKLTLVDAISAALKKHANGHAVNAEFNVDGDDYDFVVEIASGGKLYDVEIDAVTGKIEDDTEVTDAADDEKAAAAAAAKSKITLVKAIGAALQAVGGKGTRAIDAGPHLTEGKLVYEVGLLSGEDVYDVRVDGVTGKVLAQKKAE